MSNLLLILAGCTVKPAVPMASTAPTLAGWAAEVESVNSLIDFHRQRVQARPDSWVEADRLAGLLHQRARLTGDYDDYGQAEAVYADAFSHAPAGSGPLLGRARLSFTLHRLPQAQADLALLQAQPFRLPSVNAAMADLAADIALEQGQLPTARSHWQSREASTPSMRSAAALGRIDWLEGRMASADDWYAEAQQRYHSADAEPMAWMHLQRGLIDLDQGRPDAALAHYRDAESVLPGYWLVDEHIAEALSLTGQEDTAILAYRDVVDRTRSPELQGALAELLMERGKQAEAAALLATAEAAYEAQISRFPEAASGHALMHTLRWGADTAAAVEMAQQNAALRPNGIALTLLSQARLADGDVSGAASAAAQGLATGARSAELLVAAAAAAAAAGDELAAEDWLAQARDIDPTAELEG